LCKKQVETVNMLAIASFGNKSPSFFFSHPETTIGEACLLIQLDKRKRAFIFSIVRIW
jgi:hypothetical protein